jgi:hypothetical protein
MIYSTGFGGARGSAWLKNKQCAEVAFGALQSVTECCGESPSQAAK